MAYQKELQNIDESTQQNFDLLNLNIKLLNITGIIPSAEVRSSCWKYGMYRLYQLFSYFLYIIVLISQLLALYHYHDDINATTDNIAIIFTMLAGYIPSALMIKEETKICKFIHDIETKSIFTSKLIQSNDVLKKPLEKTRNLAFYLTCVAIFSFLLSGIAWTSYPMLQFIFSNDSGCAGNSKCSLKYLVFIVWVPFDFTASYWYEVTYFLQAFVLMTALAYITGMVTLYLNLIIYATAQFEVVSTLLVELDTLITAISNGEHHKALNVLKNITINKCRMLSQQTLHAIAQINEFTLNDAHIWQFTHSARYLNNPAVMMTDRKMPGPEATFSVLVESVKLHQDAIMFTNEVNKVLERNLFIICVFNTVLIITETFQLSLMFTTKYCSGFFTSMTQLYIFSFFGQRLVNQSVGVGETAYNCHWYDQPTHFKRALLILFTRAQIPVKLTLGKLLPISLELFMLVLNTSYKFYNVLLQVNEQ